jgi:hypothetical protein
MHDAMLSMPTMDSYMDRFAIVMKAGGTTVMM